MPPSTDEEPDCCMGMLNSRQLSLTFHQMSKLLPQPEDFESLHQDSLPDFGWNTFFFAGEDDEMVVAASEDHSLHVWSLLDSQGRDLTVNQSPIALGADTLHQSTPSATTATTTSWPLLVPRRSSNCGIPSPNSKMSSPMKAANTNLIPLTFIAVHSYSNNIFGFILFTSICFI